MAIDNLTDFEKWLNGQTQETCVLIAARVALRVFPNVTRHTDKNLINKTIVLMIARAILTTGVAAKMPSSEVNAAAAAAARGVNQAYSFSFNPGAGAANAATRAAYAAAISAANGTKHANSTGIAAYTAALEAAGNNAANISYADTEIEFESLFHTPIWTEPGEPDWLVETLNPNEDMLESGPEWSFWREWYHGFLIGEPMDWELQGRVALINNAIWEAGPDAVAERIKVVREQWETEQLPSKASRSKQARALMLSSGSTTVWTMGLKNLIESATAAYRREISNALPETLDPLDHLPAVLDRIAIVLSGDLDASKKEQQLTELIGQMAHTIFDLNRRLKTTHSEIEALKKAQTDGTPRRLFADAFYTKAGEGAAGLVTSKLLWGGVISGSMLLLGGDAQALTDGLTQCFKSIIAPEAPDGGVIEGLLPPVTDV